MDPANGNDSNLPRRGFLGALLAAGAAPDTRPTLYVVPNMHGDSMGWL